MGQQKWVIPDDTETDDEVPILKSSTKHESGFLDRTAELLKTFEKNHPTISKIGHRLLDVTYKTPEELETYKKEHEGNEPPKVITGMDTGSLLPNLKHSDDESWPSYIGKGLYNTLIEPLGTGPGFIGAASLRAPKVGNVEPLVKDVTPLKRIAKSAPESKLLPEFSESTNKKVYIRFGDLPEKNSTNYNLGKSEKGVSTYPAYYDERIGKYVILGDDESLWTGSNRPIHIIEGNETKFSGGDDEPLLNRNKTRIVKTITPDDVVNNNVPDATYAGTELDISDDIHSDIMNNAYNHHMKSDIRQVNNKESYINPKAKPVTKPSFIVGSEGVAKNEPYTIDLGGINPALGAKNQGTILPREVEGLTKISPDLAARRGLGIGRPPTDIDIIGRSEPELADQLTELNKAKGNIGDPSAPYQLPSAQKIIDLKPDQYKIEAIDNPNRNMGAGVKSFTRPGPELNQAKKVNFPGIVPVAETPAPGQSRSKDVSAFRAEYGSADKTLLSRPETAPIAKALTNAEDSKLQFIATTEREFAAHVKGLSSTDRILLGKALDGQSVALTPELAQKVTELRSSLDEVFKQVPDLKSTGRYVTDYLTHIAKETDNDIASGMKQVWEYHLKKPFRDFFGGEPLASKSTGIGDINETGLGSPDSPFVKERTGKLNDLEYDVNKIFPAYIESIAKNIFDKPAVQAAKVTLAKVPDKSASGEALRLKELAQWYIKNYTRYDSAPGLEQAWSSWGSKIRRTANRSMLGFSTGLQSLHAARVAANLYPELPGKYLAKGMMELAKNPKMAYEETAALGFLQGELRPWQFKTPTQKMDSILQFGSAADFLDKSIGYHGFKQMFLDQGMTAEQASSNAIAASKKASLTSSPARSIKGFSREANFAGGEAGQYMMMYKQVPARIVEQFVQIAADARANPAKFRRMITGLGIATAGTAAGVKTFHVSPSSLLPSMELGPIGATAYRIWRKVYSGDAAGALKDLVLFATPAGKSLDYQLKSGPSAFEH